MRLHRQTLSVRRCVSGPQRHRASTLGEDSFIFNDEDEANPGYFGVDSDDEGLLAGFIQEEQDSLRGPRGAARTAEPAIPAAAAPLMSSGGRTAPTSKRDRRPLSAPSAAGAGSGDLGWRRDLLRRLHQEQFEHRFNGDLASSSSAHGGKANSVARIGAAGGLAGRQGSL